MSHDRRDGDPGGLWARPREDEPWSSPEAPDRARSVPPPSGGADRPSGPTGGGANGANRPNTPAGGGADRPSTPAGGGANRPSTPAGGAYGGRMPVTGPDHGPGGAVLERFEPLRRRARIARVALVLVGIVSALSFSGNGLELMLLDRLEAGEAVTDAELVRGEQRQAVLGLGLIAALVFAAVTFVRWFNLAHRGLDALGAGRRHHTGWSIGGWFVPILNLWRPKQIANDLWAAGSPEGDPARSWLLRGWWLAFVLGLALDNAAWRRSLRADDSVADIRGVISLDSAARMVDVVGVVLALIVVGRITQRLHRRAGLAPDG